MSKEDVKRIKVDKEQLESEIRILESEEWEYLNLIREIRIHKENLIRYRFFKFGKKEISLIDQHESHQDNYDEQDIHSDSDLTTPRNERRSEESTVFIQKEIPVPINKSSEQENQVADSEKIALTIERLFYDLKLSTIPLESIAQGTGLGVMRTLSVLIEYKNKFKEVGDRVWSLKKINSFEVSVKDKAESGLNNDATLISQLLVEEDNSIKDKKPTPLTQYKHSNTEENLPVLPRWHGMRNAQIIRRIMIPNPGKEFTIDELCLEVWGGDFLALVGDERNKAKVKISNTVGQLIKQKGDRIKRIRAGVFKYR